MLLILQLLLYIIKFSVICALGKHDSIYIWGDTMRLTDFEMAHSIELEVHFNGKKTTLMTTVEGMIGNSVLMTPIHLDGRIVGFPPTVTVNLLYPEDGKVYCFSGITVKAVRYRGKIYHSAELSGDAILLNRRGAYRVYIGEDRLLLYRNRSGSKLYEVFLRDLSETGMCYMSQEQFEIGRPVHLLLRLASGYELSVRAKILWKRENPNRNTTFLYGCKFTENNKLLSSYLLNIQREILKRTLK